MDLRSKILTGVKAAANAVTAPATIENKRYTLCKSLKGKNLF